MPYIESIFISESRIIIHSVFEIFGIFVAYSIFLYGWYAYPYIQTKTSLWLPIIFFSIGTFGLLHMITFPGMPTFITESSEIKTGWFEILVRITQSAGIFLLVIFMLNDKEEKLIKKYGYILATICILLVSASIIFLFEDYLPMISNNGESTLLRVTIYLTICFIYTLSILLIIKIRKKTKDYIYIYLIMGIFFLLSLNLLTLVYGGSQGYYNFLVHFLKVLGNMYIFIGFYSSKLQLTFLKKEKMEEDLNTTQGLLESFFENTPEGLLILDNQGSILRANKGFEKIIGVKESDVIGQDFRSIMNHGDDLSDVLEQALNGSNINDFEIKQQRENGDTIYLMISLSNIQGTHTGNISAIIRDITEQKEYECNLHAAKQELTDTIRQQQGIIFKYHKVDASFIHTLFDGELYYKLWGAPVQMIGHRFSYPTGHEAFDQLLYHYQIAWDGRDVSFELEWDHISLAVSLKPIIKAAQVVEVVGSIVDITQLKKTEELLRKSEKLAVVGEMAAGVAHEIRNPLTTLKGFTQLLKMEVDDNRLPMLELMSSELNRIEMITNEFMVIAKPQAIEYKTHNIKDIMNQVLSFMEPQALLQNVTMNKLFIETEPYVQCDENQLKQVFINIIKNAFEAMPNGGSLTVEIKESNQQTIDISIKDTGVGIPKEIIPKLCEPFYTLKEKGTGLGLMISYRIIEAHKGTIAFSSNLDKGTIVTVELPLQAVEVPSSSL
ncbi:MASE3 domain-containing protein [Bacillus tuaregi]|uniref:MASE3 domain-containing protein n=1 Tax=Bacillus tuaregi TaxID=1816695 RepID=UPI000A776A89|nr:MASE3 domain-containing protein [Bacillus tuaregi]